MSAVISRRGFYLLLGYFLVSGAVFASLGIERMFSEWAGLNDLHYFYKAAQILKHGDLSLLYDPEARVAAFPASSVHFETFPFPATVAVLFWPMADVPIETARYIFLALSIACLAVLLAVTYIWSRDWRFTALLAAALASSFTVYDTLRFHQLAPWIALLACGSMLCLDTHRHLRGGLLAALIAFKPSVALLPLALLAWRLRLHRAVVLAAAVSIFIVFIGPILIVGVDGLRAYFDQLGRYREEAFLLDGKFTAGAGWMLNWIGFIGRLFQTDTPVLAALPFEVATVGLMLAVWRRGDLFASTLAAYLTLFLVIPHALWYDWMILYGVAPFVAYRLRSRLLLALLLALHLSVSIDSYVTVTTAVTQRWLFTTTLLGAATLAYLALRPAAASVEAGSAVPSRLQAEAT